MTGPPTVSSISGSGNLVRSCMEILPYDLSSHQMEALQTIYEDMDSSERRMVRLLQGDVGSGTASFVPIPKAHTRT
jgi:RecG-like helicase